jgi:hypothetical protein
VPVTLAANPPVVGPPAGHLPPSAAGAPLAPAEPVAAGAHDEETFAGQVTIDAGPFTDIATLSSFEQALGHVPGTQDVYVRGFEGSRALIDLVLGTPVALGAELRRIAPLGFTITTTRPDHLSISIDSDRHV